MKGKTRRLFRPGKARAVVPVASDRMLILPLDLPPLAGAQRRAAAQFAAEPFLSQPLEAVRVILGPRLEVGQNTYLAVVITHEALTAVLAQHDSGGILVPDVLLLPRPDADHWCVAEREGRLLARLPDGTGYSADAAGFQAIWQLAGEPGLNWVHGTPPDDLPLSHVRTEASTWQPEAALAGFDLAGDRVPEWRSPGKLLALAAVLALGLSVHLGLLAVETQDLTRQADASETKLRQALAARGVAVGTSVDAAAAAVLKGTKTDGGATFLPLLSTALDAMRDQTGLVALQDLTFDQHGGKLTMTLLASDLAPLQDTATLLTKAGLAATLGALTNGQGQARAAVVISNGGAG